MTHLIIFPLAEHIKMLNTSEDKIFCKYIMLKWNKYDTIDVTDTKTDDSTRIKPRVGNGYHSDGLNVLKI